jgi:adenylate kinase
MQKRNINVVVMGAQGSGKGTQARLIAKEYNLEHFETGGMLRNIAKEDSDLGRIVDGLINKKGEFVPWDVFEKILDQKVDELDPDRGVVFDGTPRRMEEVLFWNEKLPQVGREFDFIFYIKLTEEESISRISSRRMCKENNHTLILGKDVYSDSDKCPICGSEIYQREDDMPEKVLKRLAWNNEILNPVLDYYREQGSLIEIEGYASIEDVFKNIKKHIEDKYHINNAL